MIPYAQYGIVRPVDIQQALAKQGKEKLKGLNQVQVAKLIGASQAGVSLYLARHKEAYDQYGIVKGKHSINNTMTAGEKGQKKEQRLPFQCPALLADL